MNRYLISGLVVGVTALGSILDVITSQRDPDFDNNCTVNFADYAALVEQFLSTASALHDLNNDGVVNFGDISIFVPFFLGTPGPGGLSNACE